MFLPIVQPCTFTGSAIIIAYLLMEDLTVDEQGALGSWFTVIGDILSCNSAYLGLLNNYQEQHNDYQQLIKESLEKMQEEFEKMKDNGA